MVNMFYGISAEELNLSSWDTSNVTNMSYMFAYSPNLKKIFVSEKFKTNNVTSSNNMFDNSPLLLGGNGTEYDANHIDKEYARIDASGSTGYFTKK